jgi:hypothetical protein
MTGIEQFREIYDKGDIGLIFIGMPGLEKLKAQGKVLGRRSSFEYWKPKLIEMQQLGYSNYKMSKETGMAYETFKKHLNQIAEEI